MNGLPNEPGDARLFVTLGAAVIVALGLAASLAAPRADGSRPRDPAQRFLGLDEPVEASARPR